MNAYRVEAGTHVDGRTNQKYTKGQVVHSDQPLDQMFPQKFANLGEVQRVVVPLAAPVRAPGSATSSPSGDETSSGAKPATAPSAVEGESGASANVADEGKPDGQSTNAPKSKTTTSKTKAPAKPKVVAKAKGDDWK